MGGVEPGLVLPEFITNVVSLHPYGGYKTKHHLDSHLIFRMEDDAQQDLGDVIDIAKWVFNRPSATLVHCHMGLNRSGLITAMVLRLAGYTPEEAISTLREERSPAVLCNSVFEKFILHSQLT
jgi:protein-tyrosine phosphatase